MAIGRHYQNAYVTRNLDRAVAGFRQHTNPRLVIETEVEVALWTPQGEGTGVQKLAFVWVDDLNYELIEPQAGPGAVDVLAIYRDALPADDSLQFHHVCHRVDDWDELQAHIAANPFPVVLRGGAPGVLQFCYVDTRPWLGHYTEYLCCNAERWGQLGGR
jgi:hypothetical protein